MLVTSTLLITAAFKGGRHLQGLEIGRYPLHGRPISFCFCFCFCIGSWIINIRTSLTSTGITSLQGD